MTRASTPLYQRIAESIRRRIASGELAPGSRLPSVRKAAAEWGCDPGTVARAYALLADEGLARGHRGGGTRVMEGAMDPGNPAWGWASLVNRAETFLLEGIAAGHSPTQVESALSVAAARWTDLQEEATATEPSRSDEHLRFAGSHDLALEILAREAAGKVAVATDYVGSLGGLIALAREEADLAGIHLWDETTGEYNAPFVCRLLPGRRVMLATLVSRSVGLMVRPGNPDGIRSLADLGRVRFVNRQTGSGTRVWLDAQLRSAGVEPQNLDGYDREERTHLAVAGAVERSEADAGLGIAAAAAAAGLDFVPLTWERYDLVFPEAVWSSPAARSLVAVMRSERFAAAVAELGGYRVPGGPAEPLIVG